MPRKEERLCRRLGVIKEKNKHIDAHKGTEALRKAKRDINIIVSFAT